MLFIDMLNLLNDDHPKKIWAAKRVSWARKKTLTATRLAALRYAECVQVYFLEGGKLSLTLKWVFKKCNNIAVLTRHTYIEQREGLHS